MALDYAIAFCLPGLRILQPSVGLGPLIIGIGIAALRGLSIAASTNAALEEQFCRGLLQPTTGHLSGMALGPPGPLAEIGTWTQPTEWARQNPAHRILLGPGDERLVMTRSSPTAAGSMFQSGDRRSSIAVVGGGLAGSTAARLLTLAGHEVSVHDKGRGPGGRLASKRFDDGSVDHGAPAFTAISEPFREAVRSWVQEGVVASWCPTVAQARLGTIEPAAIAEMFVGQPRTSALVGHQLRGLQVSWNSRVTSVRRIAPGWILDTDKGTEEGPFDEIVVALPAPQAAALPGVPAQIVDRLRQVVMDPAWSVFVEFQEPVSSRFDLLLVEESPLHLAVRNGSKSGRTGSGWWTLIASGAWSRANMDRGADGVIAELLDAFPKEIAGTIPRVQRSQAHLWRYARVCRPIDQAVLRDEELAITICGDFGQCHEGVEAAWASGSDAALAIMGGHAKPATRATRAEP